MRLPRASGILLHPSSLPGPHGSGDLGAGAYGFVDWLVQAGVALWQVLPLGVAGAGNSPYASPSAFAGNPMLVDLHELQACGWLDADDLLPDAGLRDAMVDFAAVAPFREQRLQRAAQRFFERGAGDPRWADYQAFCVRHAGWLDDFALFMALSEAHGWIDWADWEPALVTREPQALAQARERHAARCDFWRFGQWCFHRQWLALRGYANARGVRIVGDAPIFVGRHSADVWAHQALFELDAGARSTVVAGVPPDYFSATGQRWGNPLYRWSAHAADGYAWWIQRLAATFELVDVVRIDHFRGFAGYWEIPAAEPTAVNGRWREGPGEALFAAVQAALGRLPVIAEDLGLITPDVEVLRRRFAFPGMRVLQFAFGGGADNRFLPHYHELDSVVYPGTHDNDTCVGWWATATPHEREFAAAYLGVNGHDIAATMVRTAFASVADTAVVAMQDLLGLDSRARMNFPGQGSGWWTWRLPPGALTAELARLMSTLGRLYDRTPPGRLAWPRG
ncbi:MAG TPA: 4-alpha-glucanotransferase [Rubrivivax sp.]|nr:4-alpha-glucanotransferase [Rubrivivax sp.]